MPWQKQDQNRKKKKLGNRLGWPNIAWICLKNVFWFKFLNLNLSKVSFRHGQINGTWQIMITPNFNKVKLWLNIQFGP